MSADVSVQSGVFPVGITWRFGRQSGFAQERGEQAVGFHGHDVMQVSLLSLQEGAFQQLNVLQREIGNFLLGLSFPGQEKTKKEQVSNKDRFHIILYLRYRDYLLTDEGVSSELTTMLR